MRIVVCPHATLLATAASESPDGIIVLHSPGRPGPVPSGPPVHVAAFHDIPAPGPGLAAADSDSVAAMLTFARWDRMLVSCEMGVSRSTAVAFALACRAAPERPEREIAAILRRACPVATPNPLVVALADEELGRRGRMSAAIRAIGRGADYAPYRSFALDLARAPA